MRYESLSELEGWRILHVAETASTNQDARAGAPGDVFWADVQRAGRGRLDHSWESPVGENLLCSLVVDVTGIEPVQVATLPLVVGLAVAQAVEGFVHHSVSLKWPNDVLVEGRKICGILCERTDDRVIAGIGVNVRQRMFPHELVACATSLALLGCAETSPYGVLEGVLRAFGPLRAVWRMAGFAALYARYRERDCLKGRILRVRQTDADPLPLCGLCEGVSSDGTLRVAGQSVWAGEAHILHDENL